MNKSKSITISIVSMIILGVFSKSLGLLREVFIASKFGSGMITDTFFLALAGVGLFASMITLSINTSIIPILSEIESNEPKENRNYYLNNLLNIIIIISIFLSVIAWFFTPYIIKLMGMGFDSSQSSLAVLLMRIGIPSLIFSGIVGIYRGYLQSKERFLESSTSQFPYNITFILYLMFFTNIYGINGLMFASVLAIASQMILQVPSLKKLDYKYKFVVNFKDKYFVKMLYLIGPILISVAVNDVNKIIDRALASSLIEGSISALNYSARINSLVLAILITAISTVLFPILTKSVMEKKFRDFKKLIINGTNIIIIIIIPITIIIAVMAEPITRLLFQIGEFTSSDTHMTSSALIFYTIGLIGMALRTYYEKAFFALHNTKTPMINGLITVILNIILNILLIGPLEYKGLALATSISTLMTTLYLFYSLQKTIGRIEMKGIWICIFKTLISGSIMGGIAYFTKKLIFDENYKFIYEFINISIIIFICLIIYVLLLYMMKTKELQWIINLVKQK